LLDFRPVLFINGILLLILAAAMCLPLAVGLGEAHVVWRAYAASALATGFVGAALALCNRSQSDMDLHIREAFLVAASAWPLLALFAALPFLLGHTGMSLADALFEATSGLTTTGATVMTGLDHMPGAILIWRALLQWLGGAGVLITALALLPMLRIGGMQLFRMESLDKAERVSRRLPQIAWRVVGMYMMLSVAVGIALYWAGMTPLEAVCHAMSCLSTGGFSTSDQSLGHFGEGARWICVLGMLLGGATFALNTASRGPRWSLARDSQIVWYLRVALAFSVLLTLWNWAANDMTVVDALRPAVFNAVSILTTTGFHTADYSAWGGFAQVAFFLMSLVGGCTGSTAGGVKIFRYEVLFAISGVHIRRLIHPNGRFPIAFNGMALTEGVVRSVLGFVLLYFCCFAGLALALTLVGLDPLSSVSGSAAALGNVGPALGSVIGPSGSYALLPVSAKALLVFGMLLGRLELLPLLLLFAHSFWKK
jgi:trk system potassium uptake protein TrkH